MTKKVYESCSEEEEDNNIPKSSSNNKTEVIVAPPSKTEAKMSKNSVSNGPKKQSNIMNFFKKN